MIWIVDISATVTGWTDYKTVFPRVENLLVHFSPPAGADEQRTQRCNLNPPKESLQSNTNICRIPRAISDPASLDIPLKES